MTRVPAAGISEKIFDKYLPEFEKLKGDTLTKDEYARFYGIVREIGDAIKAYYAKMRV